jgi:flavin reductase ActVB
MSMCEDVSKRAAYPVTAASGAGGASDAPTADVLKRAFSLVPSGVAIATVVDGRGQPQGFTASSFVPLSLEPPMVLVCLNRSAQCYEPFVAGERFAISVLRPEHQDLALRFATRGVDKFASDRIAYTSSGLPVISDALATFECSMAGRHPGGDHVILTGIIESAEMHETGEAMVHFRRSFRELAV